MNDWTSEDWRLLQAAATEPWHVTVDQWDRVQELISLHRGLDPDAAINQSLSWVRGYCEALTAERLSDAAAKMATDVNAIEWARGTPYEWPVDAAKL